MDYGMIGKIQKAKLYAEEKERITIETMVVTFNGKNNPHTVHFNDSAWNCDCEFFGMRGRCSHTMALDIILEGLLPEELPVS